MPIWQYRLTLIPESVLLRNEILPPAIAMELAEESDWWSDSQPATGFDQQISLILPEAKPWSTSMSMWGQEEGDHAHVVYSDDTKETVREIGFPLDANKISPELIRRICLLARQLMMCADDDRL
jgi:hypothetical protein